jgi:predicted protein tyrosine phosphatase
MSIWISSLALAPSLAQKHRPSKVVSLLSPYDSFPSFASLDDGCHLQVAIHDINQDVGEWQAPGRKDVESLIGFVETWDRKAPILIHCWAGISRSTASAFITACLHNPLADEEEIAQAIREASATAFPNRRLVTHADEILGRGGRMVRAIDAIGRPEIMGEAEPFFIPSSYRGKAR